MSGQFRMAWILADGSKGRSATAFSQEIAEKLRDTCAAEIVSARYFVILEEEIETWMAQ